MIKIIILISIFGLCGYVGLGFGKIYKNKILFYEEYKNFCELLKNEISFLKTDLISIISKCKYKSCFKDVLSFYENSLKNNADFEIEKLCNKISKNIFLDEEDKRLINNLFIDLGLIGYDEQLKKINWCGEEISKKMEKYKSKSDKFIPLCNKMGFLVGLLVCIVLI